MTQLERARFTYAVNVIANEIRAYKETGVTHVFFSECDEELRIQLAVLELHEQFEVALDALRSSCLHLGVRPFFMYLGTDPRHGKMLEVKL